MSDRRKIPIVAYALAAAFVARASLFAAAALATKDVTVFHAPDSMSYIVAARNLLSSGCFNGVAGPDNFRTPGFPALLMIGVLAGRVELDRKSVV